MRLFNVNRLSNELRAGAVSEADKCRYLAVMLVLHSLQRAWSSSARPASGLLVTIALTALTSVVALVLCFRANQRGDGRDFVERLICLSVPITIWYVLLFEALFYGSYALSVMTLGNGARQLWSSAFPMIFQEVALVAYYGALCYFVSRTASISNATAPPPIALP